MPPTKHGIPALARVAVEAFDGLEESIRIDANSFRQAGQGVAADDRRMCRPPRRCVRYRISLPEQVVENHKSRQIREPAFATIVLLQCHHDILKLGFVAETFAAPVDGNGARHWQPTQAHREKRLGLTGDRGADEKGVVDRDAKYACSDFGSEGQRIAYVGRGERIHPFWKSLKLADQFRTSFIAAGCQDDAPPRAHGASICYPHAGHAPAFKQESCRLRVHPDRCTA